MTRHDLEFGSIPRMVQRSAERFGAAEAVVDLDADVRWSFQDVAARMVGSVRAAIAFGVQPGDRVAVWAPNSAGWIEAALGILGAGAVLVPLNTRFKGPEVAYAVRKSGAMAVFTVGEFTGNDYPTMLREQNLDVPVVLIGGGSVDGTTSWSDYLAGGSRIDEAVALARIDAVRSEDVSDMLFTSGTTGAPKGAVVTHGQSLRNFGQASADFTFAAGDRFLLIPPFFHVLGYKCGWMACLMHGATAIPQPVFDVDVVLQRLADERVSILLGSPTLFTDILEHPRRGEFDLSRLRVTAVGATTVPVELYERLRDDLGFEVVLSAYGMTEAGVISYSGTGDDTADVANSVGRPGPGIEVKLVDDTGAEVETGAPGEILVRGYLVMRGYWDDPGATAEAIEPDGWFHTGDVGVFDERGLLKIVDRKKDMFIVGGFNAYPAEIEHTLRQHPDVIDVSVIGVPDDRMGEVGAAYVIAKNLDAGDLTSWVRERLANFKVPRHVVFVDDFPRNPSLKVLKGALREDWAARVA